MPLVEAEINAEKAAKPRPDLFPARAALAIRRALPTTDDRTAYELVLAADDSLRDFVMTHDVRDLARAGALVCVAIGRSECTGSLRVESDYAHAILRAGAVMGYGLAKHGRCTWRIAGTEQADPQTHYSSACRHVLEWLVDVNARESGSNFPVLWHLLSQIGITIDLLLDPPRKVGENDEHIMVPASLVEGCDCPC
jgi:hypothetical protein